MNILKLTIKKKYFDMIYSEEKKEEYREIKDYYIKRLKEMSLTRLEAFKHYDFVELRNGYSKKSPKLTLVCEKIEIGFGKEHLGAEPNKLYFVIKLGRIVKIENVIYKTKPHD